MLSRKRQIKSLSSSEFFEFIVKELAKELVKIQYFLYLFGILSSVIPDFSTKSSSFLKVCSLPKSIIFVIRIFFLS